MRVGTFCYDTDRGLGHLARDFYKHGVLTDVFVVEHPSIPSDRSRYPNAERTKARTLNKSAMKDFARRMDVMLFFETPFMWEIIPFCRMHNVGTALITMYECTPKVLPAVPSLFLCPSLLDVEYFKKHNYRFIPLPVEADWKLRTKAELFVHNGGYLGLRGREGTREIIEAMEHVKSPLKLRIRVQENVEERYIKMCEADPRITYEAKTFPYGAMFDTGDVYVAAQKFNGCSLPLQEAYASGMLVMTTDRFPMNTWLPTAPMFPASSVRRAQIGGTYNFMDECIVDPRAIARCMDEWYGKDTTSFSVMGRKWAEQNSWDVLKPKYMEALQSVSR